MFRSLFQPHLMKLVKKFQALPVEKLFRHTKTRDFCFTIERLPYGKYAITFRSFEKI